MRRILVPALCMAALLLAVSCGQNGEDDGSRIVTSNVVSISAPESISEGEDLDLELGIRIGGPIVYSHCTSRLNPFDREVVTRAYSLRGPEGYAYNQGIWTTKETTSISGLPQGEWEIKVIGSSRVFTLSVTVTP